MRKDKRLKDLIRGIIREIVKGEIAFVQKIEGDKVDSFQAEGCRGIWIIGLK